MVTRRKYLQSTPLDQEEMYLIDFSSELEKGIYVLAADILKEKMRQLLPKELQVAYTFEVK